MEVAFSIFETMATMADAVIAIFMFNQIFEKKENHRYIYDVLMVCVYTAAVDSLGNYFWMQSFVGLGLLSLYSVLFYKGKIIYKILITCVFDIILTVINGFGISMVAFVSQMKILDLIQSGTLTRVILLVIVKITLFFAIYIFTLFFNRKNRNYQAGIVQILTFIISLILTTMMEKIVGETNVSRATQIEYMIMLIAIIAINVIIYIVMQQLENKHKREQQELYLEGRIEEEQNLIKEIRLNQEKISEIRHDIKHYYSLLNVYLSQGQYEEAKELIKSVMSEADYGKDILYCDNITINSILGNKKRICDRDNIEFKVFVRGSIAPEDEDRIGIMLMNLIDNAIEAEKYEKFKKIELKIVVDRDKYDISVSNTIENSVLNKNKKLNTTKSDKSNHGYGLKSVKRMAEQSGGLADIFEEDGMFVVRIEFFSKKMSFVPKNM